MSGPQTITLDLEPTDRTDVLCVACGGFTTKARGRAYVFAKGAGDFGLHHACIGDVKRHRAPASEHSSAYERAEAGFADARTP